MQKSVFSVAIGRGEIKGARRPGSPKAMFCEGEMFLKRLKVSGPLVANTSTPALGKTIS